MAVTQTGTILGTIDGKNSHKVQVQIVWTAIPRADNTGHDVSFVLQTRRVVSGVGTFDNNPTYLLKINNTVVVDQKEEYKNPINYGNYTTNEWYTIVSAPSTFIKHTNSLSIPLYGYFSIGSEWINSGTVSGNITLNALYTKCSPPTEITFSSVVKPGGELTITWSGAGNGEGGSNISSYDVYYNIGSAPTTSSGGYMGYQLVDVTDGSLSGSCVFTIPYNEGLRGNSFYAIIRARSTAGADFYSGFSGAKSGGKVNTLPKITNATCTPGYSELPWSGGSVKITTNQITLEESDGQEISYQYKYESDSDSNAIPFSSEATIPFDAGSGEESTQKFYIRPFDKLEYGAWFEIGAKQVKKPQISFNINHDGYEQFEVDGETYYKGFTLATTGAEDLNGQYRFNFSRSNDSFKKELILQEESSYSINNLLETLSSDEVPSPEENFGFSVQFEQKIDNPDSNISDEIEIQNSAWTYPNLKLDNVYNQDDTSNILEPVDGILYFSQKLRQDLIKDSGLTEGFIVSYSSDNTNWYMLPNERNILIEDEDNSYPYVVFDTSQLEYGKTYEFKITAQRDNQILEQKISKYTFQKINKLNTDQSMQVNCLLNTVYPHTVTDTSDGITITFSNVLSKINSNDYIKYGFKNLNKAINMAILYNNDKEEILPNTEEFHILNGEDIFWIEQKDEVIDGDLLICKIKERFYNTLVNKNDGKPLLGMNNFNGKKQIYFIPKISTVFGEQYDLVNKNNITYNTEFTLNFDESINVSNYAITLNNSKASPGSLICEGDTIEFNIDCKTYNTYNLTFSNLFAENSELFIEKVEILDKTKQKLGEPQTIPISITKTIGIIEKAQWFKFKGTVSNQVSSKESEQYDAGRSVRHVALKSGAEFVFNSGIYNNPNVDVKFEYLRNLDTVLTGDENIDTVLKVLNNPFSEEQALSTILLEAFYSTDPNFPEDKTETRVIYNDEKEYNSISSFGKTGSLNSLNGFFTPDSNTFQANVYYVKLRLTSTFKGVSKYSETPVLLVYNTTPTISYRQNQVGINYKLPLEIDSKSDIGNAILVIGEASGKNQIIYVGAAGYGKLIGFQFDGGSWDKSDDNTNTETTES